MYVCRTVYGEVSAKVDVYAFGVVLYELISAKGAVVKMTEVVGEFRGLVGVVSILTTFRHSDLKTCTLDHLTYALFLYYAVRRSIQGD